MSEYKLGHHDFLDNKCNCCDALSFLKKHDIQPHIIKQITENHALLRDRYQKLLEFVKETGFFAIPDEEFYDLSIAKLRTIIDTNDKLFSVNTIMKARVLLKEIGEL